MTSEEREELEVLLQKFEQWLDHPEGSELQNDLENKDGALEYALRLVEHMLNYATRPGNDPNQVERHMALVMAQMQARLLQLQSGVN